MTGARTIVGKWRFTATSTLDRDHIDLVEPGYIAFAVRDMGEMASLSSPRPSNASR